MWITLKEKKNSRLPSWGLKSSKCIFDNSMYEDSEGKNKT